MAELSILIPAKNEEFLGITIQNILDNIEGDTEIIAVLDGYETEIPELPEDSRVTYINNIESKGQRAGTNQACMLSSAKYVMKVDAHCAFDKGFDVKLMAKMRDDYTMVPVMRNLHAFDWECFSCGKLTYQGPTPTECKDCGCDDHHKKMRWIGKNNPQSVSYCFDDEPHFQYFKKYSKRPEYKAMKEKDNLTESMSLQGSAFLLTRDKYWELNISDEELGSWGSQGIEVACKTWLSGGRVIVNHDTWYAHMFRTQGGDFGFPYNNPGKKVQSAKKGVKKLFFDNNWEGQIKPLSWLIEKFWPVDGWSEDMRQRIKNWPLQKDLPSRGIIYYSDNKLKWSIAQECRKQIKSIGLPIVSCTLKKSNMGKNIVFDGERGYETMFKQILTALEASDSEIIYFTEHDVLYHPSHFDFIPKDRNKFYYEGNYWVLRANDGHAVSYDLSPLSGLVAYREELITHFKERIKMIQDVGFSYNMGFEPFTHKRIKWNTWYDFEIFKSEYPCIDIAHDKNVTNKRWDKSKFRREPKDWKETTYDKISGWSKEQLERIIENV